MYHNLPDDALQHSHGRSGHVGVVRPPLSLVVDGEDLHGILSEDGVKLLAVNEVGLQLFEAPQLCSPRVNIVLEKLS